MNNLLRKTFTLKPSYFKKGCNYITRMCGCSTADVLAFRSTPWYKKNRRTYCR